MAEPAGMQGAGRMPLVILGAGGHGHVVADSVDPTQFHLLGFVDSHPDQVTDAAHPLLGQDHPTLTSAQFIAAVGDNAIRRRLFEQWLKRGATPATIVHRSAAISSKAELGKGVFVGPQVVVNTRALVADNVILNSGCVIEHDCRIAAHCHVAPGAVLAGGVSVGEQTLIGLGAGVLPGLSIGSRCIIGAGAVVVRDVHDGVTVIGIPANTR
ncbi:MAG: acetyltransferase [Phycisphaeraceae bacterium]|nr:acetyltransferase [Phycisphaeraceae bacterium]